VTPQQQQQQKQQQQQQAHVSVWAKHGENTTRLLDDASSP